MGLKANKVLKEAKPVRNILYGDGYYCKKIKYKTTKICAKY